MCKVNAEVARRGGYKKTKCCGEAVGCRFWQGVKVKRLKGEQMCRAVRLGIISGMRSKYNEKIRKAYKKGGPQGEDGTARGQQ